FAVRSVTTTTSGAHAVARFDTMHVVREVNVAGGGPRIPQHEIERRELTLLCNLGASPPRCALFPTRERTIHFDETIDASFTFHLGTDGVLRLTPAAGATGGPQQS